MAKRKKGMTFIPYDYEAAYNKSLEDMNGKVYRRGKEQGEIGEEISSNSGDHSQEIQGTGSHCTDETGGNTGLFFQRFAVVYIPHNHDIAGR